MIFQHEKHSFFPKLRSPAQKLLKTSYLVLRGGVAFFKGLQFTILMLLAMLYFVPEAAFGQQGGPGTAWTAGVNFHSNSPCDEDSWSFNAVEMDNGDLVVVGYTTTPSDTPNCVNPHIDPNNNTWRRVPAYAVLDKNGSLRTSAFYPRADSAGAFTQIAKTLDGGVVLAGWEGQRALLTKLSSNYTELWRYRFDVP